MQVQGRGHAVGCAPTPRRPRCAFHRASADRRGHDLVTGGRHCASSACDQRRRSACGARMHPVRRHIRAAAAARSRADGRADAAGSGPALARSSPSMAMMSRSSVRAALRFAARAPDRASIACSRRSSTAGSALAAQPGHAVDIVGLVRTAAPGAVQIPARQRRAAAGRAALPAPRRRAGRSPAAPRRRARQIGADRDQDHSAIRSFTHVSLSARRHPAASDCRTVCSPGSCRLRQVGAVV